jgi:hypothetical protein
MKALTCYWEKVVDEAEKRPQTIGATLRTRWLFAGTNYQRMIEPLFIAEYYKEPNQRDYINLRRPKHFKIIGATAQRNARNLQVFQMI